VLFVEGAGAIRNYFMMPSYGQLLSRFQSLDEADLVRQLAIIEGTFQAKRARRRLPEHEIWRGSCSVLGPEELTSEAQAIGEILSADAVVEQGGGANWIGLGFAFHAERFRLQALGPNLYDGLGGIALFLAALARVCGEARFADLARRALQPLRLQVKTADPQMRRRTARLVGIGGGFGLGSWVYALARVATFLNDASLLQDCSALAEWITPESIAADPKLDVLGGAAGAILGLLALHGATGEEHVLERAVACGRHLLDRRSSHEGAPRAWRTIADRPLAGFSHGAAGIAYALLKLYAATGDDAYRDAGLEGMEYERSLFSEAEGNWLDLRKFGSDEPPSFPIVWCHGAAGIGLSRLGILGIAPSAQVQQEIEVAVRTSKRRGLDADDHLCCGNMGRFEVMLVGAQRCGRKDWHRSALRNLSYVVERARHAGSYRLAADVAGARYQPSLFRGIAGIGYELLRAANHDLPSALLWE
jgi:type 2 lantibiotic biosynthesis protein LanM